MRNLKAVEVYHILKDVLISGMSVKGQRAILKNLRSLKPLAEDYSAAVQEAQEKMKPEGFEDIQRKANTHNEAVKAGVQNGLLSGEELMIVTTIYTDYNKNFTLYVNELNEEEKQVDICTLSEEDFGVLISTNDKKNRSWKVCFIGGSSM